MMMKKIMNQDNDDKKLLPFKKIYIENKFKQVKSYTDPERKGGSIQTFSGEIFYPLDPKIDEIHLVDIAHGLSNKARFTGQTKKFFSTAQHSYNVSDYLRVLGYDVMVQFIGLHHDDTDAYLPDVATPLKILPEFAWFRDLEHYMQDLCFAKFGCVVKDYKPVKEVDIIMLLTEKRDLMPKRNSNWNHKYTQKPVPKPYKIIPWPPEEAEEKYLQKNKELSELLFLTQ